MLKHSGRLPAWKQQRRENFLMRFFFFFFLSLECITDVIQTLHVLSLVAPRANSVTGFF